MTASPNLESPTDEQLAYVEDSLGITLPIEYKMFLKIGGGQDLSISLEVAGVEELLEARDYVKEHKCLPFASNTYGDLYCLYMKNKIEYPVIVWHLASQTFRKESNSFASWLSTYLR